MTGSNHRVKCSYYSHQIPITGIADFLCLPQAGIASPSLFVLHSYLTQLLNKYIWHIFLSCFLSFHSNISPSPPKACCPPSSLFHYFVICPWHLCCPDSWNFSGLFAFSFPDLGLGKFKSLKFFLVGQLHSTSCLLSFLMSNACSTNYSCSVALKWPKSFHWTSPTDLRTQSQRPFIFLNSF